MLYEVVILLHYISSVSVYNNATIVCTFDQIHCFDSFPYLVIRTDDSVMADTAVQESPTVSEVRKCTYIDAPNLPVMSMLENFQK